MPTQTMGLMSTPPKGGINFRVGIKKGSVGHATRLKGKQLRFTWGYQVRTIRKINKKVIKPTTGPISQLARVVASINNYIF